MQLSTPHTRPILTCYGALCSIHRMACHRTARHSPRQPHSHPTLLLSSCQAGMNGVPIVAHSPQSTAANLSSPSPTTVSNRPHPPFLGPIPAAGPPVGTGTAGRFDRSTIRFRSISSYTRVPRTPVSQHSPPPPHFCPHP